jgi:hypothetical protein
MNTDLVTFFKDTAKQTSLEEIIASIIADLEANKDYENAINDLIDIIPEVKKIFSANIEIEVGSKKYSLTTDNISKDKLLEIFNRKIKDRWVIAVDESQQQTESYIGNVFYRHSMAYGMKIAENCSVANILFKKVLSEIKASSKNSYFLLLLTTKWML